MNASGAEEGELALADCRAWALFDGENEDGVEASICRLCCVKLLPPVTLLLPILRGIRFPRGVLGAETCGKREGGLYPRGVDDNGDCIITVFVSLFGNT